jgi:hypothetical protein
MDVFCFRDNGAGPTLLVQAEQVVERTCSMTERLRVGDGRYNVGFRKKNGLGKSSAKGKMASEGRRKGASRAMRGGRALALGLKNLFFDSASSRKAEQVDGFFQMASGDDDVGSSKGVKTARRLAHGIE